MKKYKPSELLFAIQSEMENLPAIVLFTTKEVWEKDKCQSDDLGGHNMPGEELLKCGVFDVELAESAFETTGEFSDQEIRQRLLDARFGEDEEFTKFILN